MPGACAGRRTAARRPGRRSAVNEGPAAGASLDHSHSQVVPFAEIPPGVAAQAPAFGDACALCAALGIEDARTVRRADGLRTIAPAWSRFAYELWIAPDAHVAEPGWGELATAIADAAQRLRAVLGRRSGLELHRLRRARAATSAGTGTPRCGRGSRSPRRPSWEPAYGSTSSNPDVAADELRQTGR